MPLEIRPLNKLTYKLKLTPQTRLNLNLLQIPLVKLKEYIIQQIEENPILEAENVKSPIPKEKFETFTKEDEEKRNYKAGLITKPHTLQEYLLEQFHLLTDSSRDREIGESIIGNIDDDGYLRCPIKDIAGSVKVRTSQVEKVLSLIQTFDPIGAGARDLRECLLLQLKAKGEENSLSWQIIDKYLPSLEKKKFDHIAKKLRVSYKKIKEAMKEIKKLEPKPGRTFSSEKTMRLVPDAVLRKSKEGYEAVFNNWELPRLTLNVKYRQMIAQKDTPQDAKEYLRERLKAARALIGAINKRRETLQSVTQEIINFQKGFFDSGEPNFKPMTLSQIASRVGKHKSTVSRAISNKYLQTPHGIYELRYFLNSGVKQKGAEPFSSKSIKLKVKNLTANENKKNPLSDQKIVELLKKDGISISRRAIAKYRTHLKILSSKSRRE